jgi:hypothetical protein
MKEKQKAMGLKDEDGQPSPTKHGHGHIPQGPGLTSEMMKNIQSPGSLH